MTQMFPNLGNTAAVTASGEEVAERIRAAMGDRSTPDEREQRRRRFHAVKSCSHCVACWSAFEPGQPVYREKRHGRDLAPVCVTCKSKWGHFDDGAACEGCGRTVHNPISGRERLRTFCSKTCEVSFRSKANHDRRVQARGTRQCLVCEETFQPQRADAKFCSVACKQKQYRNRVTDAVCANNYTNSNRNGGPAA